jgi:hypothetical protein
LLQQLELVESSRGQIAAAGAPLYVDHTVDTFWRAPGDLAFVASNALRYTVVSQPVEPTVRDLRELGSQPASALPEAYLSLPEEIPDRVLALADEVVSGVADSYGRAQVLETFLRTYTYTLDLPAPPGDQDLVDHFLFNQQEGYCDYFASAMVVMARAVGLPARLASGYAQGTYDYERDVWVVTERDSHSWAEVYFEGIGWVEFEPTAGQPTLVRPGGQIDAPVVPPLPDRQAARLQLPWLPLFLAGGVGLLAILAVVIWRAWKRAGQGTEEVIRDRYARLVRWGERLDSPYSHGQTASEFGASLVSRIQTLGKEARWHLTEEASSKAPGDVQRVVEAYVRVQYDPGPSLADSKTATTIAWNRLKWRLFWLWLGR